MEKKYILPASTLFAGIIIWIIFLIVYPNENNAQMREVLIGIVTGGIIFFSAFTCRRAGGPKGGNIFRASLMFVMAVISYWLIGITAAIILLAASAAIILLLAGKSEAIKEAES
jgi:uncharacterized membrane protein